MRRVVGLDLSLTSTGLALIEGKTLESPSLTAVHNVKSKGKKGDTYREHLKRLDAIVGEIRSTLWDWGSFVGIDLAVIEAPSFGSKFGSPHERAGLWWEVVKLLDSAGIPVAEVAPATRAKYITGSGRASKDVVLAHAIERYVVLGGPRITNDDIADAVGLADMGARHLGISPIPCKAMPEANLQGMAVVKWPELNENKVEDWLDRGRHV